MMDLYEAVDRILKKFGNDEDEWLATAFEAALNMLESNGEGIPENIREAEFKRMAFKLNGYHGSLTD